MRCLLAHKLDRALQRPALRVHEVRRDDGGGARAAEVATPIQQRKTPSYEQQGHVRVTGLFLPVNEARRSTVDGRADEIEGRVEVIGDILVGRVAKSWTTQQGTDTHVAVVVIRAPIIGEPPESECGTDALVFEIGSVGSELVRDFVVLYEAAAAFPGQRNVDRIHLVPVKLRTRLIPSLTRHQNQHVHANGGPYWSNFGMLPEPCVLGPK